MLREGIFVFGVYFLPMLDNCLGWNGPYTLEVNHAILSVTYDAGQGNFDDSVSYGIRSMYSPSIISFGFLAAESTRLDGKKHPHPFKGLAVCGQKHDNISYLQ